MDSFLKYFTFVTAVIAFLQPYALYLYKRFFKARKIVAYSFERLEVGFNHLGSYIGYLGSLISKNAESFVPGAEITLQRADGASLSIRWILTREQHIELAGERGEARLALGLVLKKDEPAPVDLLFARRDLPKELTRLVEIARAAWNVHTAVNQQPAGQRPLLPPSFGLFAQTPPYLALLQALQSHQFWRAGKYSGTLVVRLHDESEAARLPLAFEITDEDQQKIETQLRWTIDVGLTGQATYPIEKVFTPNLILSSTGA